MDLEGKLLKCFISACVCKVYERKRERESVCVCVCSFVYLC